MAWTKSGTLGSLWLKAASNLSDLADKAQARTNLGLGSAATVASTAFDAAGAATTAAARRTLWRGSWSTTITYVLNDMVVYNGQLYVCTVNTATLGTFATTDWTFIGDASGRVKGTVRTIPATSTVETNAVAQPTVLLDSGATVNAYPTMPFAVSPTQRVWCELAPDGTWLLTGLAERTVVYSDSSWVSATGGSAVSNADLNNAVMTGSVYMPTNAGNTPDASVRWYVQVIRHANSYVQQTAYSSDGRIRMRELVAGAWTGWVAQAPPPLQYGETGNLSTITVASGFQNIGVTGLSTYGSLGTAVNTTTGVFTAPVDGFYQVSATGQFPNSVTTAGRFLMQFGPTSGSSSPYFRQEVDASTFPTYATGNIGGIMHLAAGATVFCQIYCSGSYVGLSFTGRTYSVYLLSTT